MTASTWEQIAATIPAKEVQWRQQGRGKPRDGKFFAPFVAYIDAQFVRERLDMIVPGQWTLALEMLPPLTANGDGEAIDEPIAFKAALTIQGVTREDVGMGRDYKNASTDAFKRAAVRFGVAHELYTDYEILWVQVDGDGKYAKPLEDPATVYARKLGGGSASQPSPQRASSPASTNGAPSATVKAASGNATPTARTATDVGADVSCPKCGGRMFDNRLTKRNPKAPDFKCRSRSCDGVVWPPRAPRSEPEPGEFPTDFADAPPHDDADADLF